MNRTSTLMPLADAVARHVRDGSALALEGFTHLIPFAAGHELIRQRRVDLRLHRMTPDVIYDQLIGMGCAAELVFSWGGNPGVGSLHRLRDAVEAGWPRPLTLHEHSHADLANAYVAGASGLPFAVLRAYEGTDYPRYNPRIRSVVCPFTGEKLAAVPSIRLDTAIIHAQQADAKGNVQLWGLSGVQKEAALCARQVIVTVEELVDELELKPGGVILPRWVISAVCHVPRGATPSYAAGYYARDNAFYTAWDGIARERETFQAWMRSHVLETGDFEGYLRVLEGSRAKAGSAAHAA